MNDSTNLTTSIIQTINSIFETLFSSVDTTVYNILDDLVFIDTSILNDSIFKKTFGINSYNTQSSEECVYLQKGVLL